MTIKEDVDLLKRVLRSPRIIPKISKFRLFTIIRKWNLQTLYVGNRVDHFPASVTLFKEDGLNGKSAENERRLFYHESGDQYYYDILDENIKCDRQSENQILIAPHVCMNVSKLENCLSSPKTKYIGGKRWKV